MEDKCKKIPITVLVPTINAEPHLDELLDGVQPFFEDVIVVDSLSCDQTVDICLRRGVKVIQRPFVTSSDQFGWMVTKIHVTTPWLMTLAQDERVSPELRRLMAENVTADAPFSGFMTRWRLWFMGGPLHAAPWRMNVYRVGKVAVTDVTCNEHFYLTDGGPVGSLDGIIEHKDTPTLWDWYEKQNLYTTREAIGVVLGKARTEKPKLFGTKDERNHWLSRALPRIPLGLGYLIMFMGYYLRYGAWKDGWAGFYWARCRVWVNWVVEFKVEEIRRTGVIPKMPEPRRGTFDVRVMRSDLQRRLLPEVVEAWERQRREEAAKENGNG